MTKKQRIIVNGALGKMGRETLKAVAGDHELLLSGAVDLKSRGEDVSELTGIPGLNTLSWKRTWKVAGRYWRRFNGGFHQSPGGVQYAG